MELAELIKTYTLLPGTSGCEGAVASLYRTHMEPLCDRIETTPMGNVLAHVRGGDSSGPVIALAAHMDEVGFLVADITGDGFLRLESLGRFNPLTLAASPVDVHAGDKVLPGIIGAVPPHHLQGAGLPEISDLFVDVGASSREEISRMGVQLGDPVIPATRFHYDGQSRRIFTKALDDRIGVASMIALAERIAGTQLPCRVVCCATVQEEVGIRGAEALSRHLQADVVLVLEGAPADDTPGINASSQTRVGGGAHVRIYDPRMIAHRGLLRYVRELVSRRELRVQETVRRNGGTDGGSLHLSGGGIPSIVFGVPVRYAHSHNAMCCIDDFTDLLELLVCFCREFNQDACSNILSVV